jgi:ribosome recycling factor
MGKKLLPEKEGQSLTLNISLITEEERENIIKTRNKDMP